jgi:uncharacterized protein (TIGR00297 family)
MERLSAKEHFQNLAFRTLDLSGFLLAVLIAAVLVIFGGISYLVLMILFFVLASFFTFFGARKKGRHALRAWRNVFANGIFPAVGAVLGSRALFFGALTAVASDKIAGEVGLTSSRKPVLITSPWRHVLPGTNGGITLLGELAAVMTGAFFGAVSFLLFGDRAFFAYSLVGVIVGFLGANFDSLLGAALENRGLRFRRDSRPDSP